MAQTGSPVRSYLLGFACVGCAVAARLALDRASAAVPFLPFFLAVIAASTYGGFGPGLLTTLLSTVATLWLVSPAGLAAGGRSALGILLPFIAVAVLVSWLIDRLRQAQRVSEERLAVQRESAQRADLAQQWLAAIVASSDDAIIGKSLNGVVTTWNRGAERLFGYTAAEAIGSPISLIIPADRLDEEQRVRAWVRQGQPVEQFETVRICKDGSLVDVSITVSPIKDSSGAIVGASKIARDITERRRTDRLREELLERERRALAEAVAARDRLEFLAEVSALLTSSLDYQETVDRAVHLALPRLGDYCNVLVQDGHGQLQHVAWAHVAREKEPALRELVRQVLQPADRPGVPTFSDVVMKTGKSITVSHDAMSAAVSDLAQRGLAPGLLELGADLRPYAYVGVPLMARGRVVGVMSFGTGERESRREYAPADLTLVEEFARRVSLAIENARLFRQADELNRLKDEFLATLSHELRTPLAAVLGWSRMLVTGQLDADKRTHALQAIERNAQAQARIIDDILDVARGMAGNLRLIVQRIDLVAVTHRSVDAIAPAAAAKQIDVRVHAPAPVPVAGDPGRLQQVVWNVLSNAVKFTDAGGRIAVAIGVRDGHAELEVTDTGVGISPAFLPYVFDKFRQADASFTRQHAGLGLGLAIARHLVELHGGAIEAQSAGEGHGATFLIRLPAAPSHSEELGN